MKNNKLISIIKKVVFTTVCLSIFIYSSLTIINAYATWTTTSLTTVDLGYGVTYDVYKGTSKSNFNTVTQSNNREQIIYTVNVPKESKASVVIWGKSGNNNSWGVTTLENIARDYELKHPDKKVLCATNNWLSDTKSNNIGELDAVQVIDGLNYRVSDLQGTLSGDSVTFAHGYINRPNFLGFDETGKTAYFSDDWQNGDKYAKTLSLSYYNGYDKARTMLNIDVPKINQAPSENEVAIIFPNYNGETTFTDAKIYLMGSDTIRYDMAKGSQNFTERDAFAKGYFIKEVDTIDFSTSTDQFYFVSKNTSFNELDLTDKEVVCQYELLGEFNKVVGATTYYYRIVKDGEEYPEGHSHEINDEVHPRTAFIIKEDGSFALSVIDGRRKEASGMEYMEMSHFYKTMYQGYNVFNYDGGGSSAMIIANNNGDFDLVNAPSDGHERAVGNATMVVVDRDPYTLEQVDVHESQVTLKVTSSKDNLGTIYASLNNETIPFTNGKVTFTNLTKSSTYQVKTSFIDSTGVIHEGMTYQTKTCAAFVTIDQFNIMEVTQDSASIYISLNDIDDTLFQGLLEVDDKKCYFQTEETLVLIPELYPETEYTIKLHIYSLNGTNKQHEDIYEYKLTTSEAVYPVKITPTVDTNILAVGDTTRVKVTYDPLETYTRLTYSSSNEQIATVSDNGRVTAISSGFVDIIVTTREGVTGKVSLKIVKKPTNLQLSSISNILPVGYNNRLVVNFEPNDTEGVLTYSSSNEDVITIDEAGFYKTLSVGEATITVSTNGGSLRKSITINVLPKATSVEVSVDKKVLLVNETTNLKVVTNPTDAYIDYSYSISNTNIITMDNDGVITAHAKGTATIIINTNDSFRKELTITVRDKITDFLVDVSKTTLKVNDIEQIKLTYNPSDALIQVTYETSNAKVATVSPSGEIKAISAGEAVITIMTSDGVNTTLTINVESETKKSCKKKSLVSLSLLTGLSVLFVFIRKKKN